MSGKYIIMDEKDNCATSLDTINESEELDVKGKKIRINHEIPFGHKFSLREISKGELIKKYGQIIGIATEDIRTGDWIHTHNVKSYYLEAYKT